MSKFISCIKCNKTEGYTTSWYKKVYGEIPYKCSICCGGKMDSERAFFHLSQVPINDVLDKEKLYSLIQAYHHVYHIGNLGMTEKEWHINLNKIGAELMEYWFKYVTNNWDCTFLLNLIEVGETERVCNEWLKYESNELEDEADLDPIPHSYYE